MKIIFLLGTISDEVLLFTIDASDVFVKSGSTNMQEIMGYISEEAYCIWRIVLIRLVMGN